MTNVLVDYEKFQDLQNAIFPLSDPISQNDKAKEFLHTDDDNRAYTLRAILGQLTYGSALSNRDQVIFPHFIYGVTYQETLREAKNLSALIGTGVPICAELLCDIPPLVVVPDTDVEAHWKDALQNDQNYYHQELQRYKEKGDQPGWGWTKEFSEKLLSIIDEGYGLSANMERVE
jgi:hypothetical protein